MSRTMQSKVLNDIIKSIVETNNDLEVIQVPNWANTGKLSIQHNENVGEFGDVYYNFQNDTMTFSITINRKKITSQVGRDNYFDFYMRHTDVDCYKKFKNRLIESVKMIQLS